MFWTVMSILREFFFELTINFTFLKTETVKVDQLEYYKK
jgi:hypothetical protein